MNDAQLFIIFGSILAFGWIGYITGEKADKERVMPFAVLFFCGSAVIGISALVNLGRLLARSL